METPDQETIEKYSQLGVTPQELEDFLGQVVFRATARVRPFFFPFPSRFLFRPFPFFAFPPLFGPRVFPFQPQFPFFPPFTVATTSWRFRVIFFSGGSQWSSEVLQEGLTESQAAVFMNALATRYGVPGFGGFPFGVTPGTPWPPQCIRVEAYQLVAGQWQLWRVSQHGNCP